MKAYLFLFLLLFPLYVFPQKNEIHIVENLDWAEFVYDSIEFKDDCTILKGYFTPVNGDCWIMNDMNEVLKTKNKRYHLLYTTLPTRFYPIKTFKRGVKYLFEYHFEPIKTLNKELYYSSGNIHFLIPVSNKAIDKKRTKSLRLSINTIDSLLNLKKYSEAAFAINKLAHSLNRKEIDLIKYLVDKYKIDDFFLNCQHEEAKMVLRLFENTFSILNINKYNKIFKQFNYIDSIQDSIDVNVREENWHTSVTYHKILLSKLKDFDIYNKYYERSLISFRKSLIYSNQYDLLPAIDKKIIEILAHNYDNSEDYLNRLYSVIFDSLYKPGIHIKEDVDIILWQNVMSKSININKLMYAQSLKNVATYNLHNNNLDLAINQYLAADSLLVMHCNNKDSIDNINSQFKINYKWERDEIRKMISICYFNKNDLSNALKYDSCNIYYNFKNNDTAKVISLCKQKYLKNMNSLRSISRRPILLDVDSYYSYINFDWIFSEALYADIPYYAYMTNNPELCSMAFNGSLITKGFRLYNEIQVNKYVNTSTITELRSLSDKLNLNVQEYYKGNKAFWDIIHQRQKIIDYLNEIKFFDNNTLECNDIKRLLNDDEIAIDFLEVPLKEKETTFYFAMTLKNNYANPHIIPIGESDSLKSLIDIKSYSNGSIHKTIWKPILKELQGINKAYFSPVGLLNYIAIENCDSLIKHIELYRLSSMNELINKDKNNLLIKNAILYGGLLYNMNEKSNNKELLVTRGTLNDISISTQYEVDSITSLLTNKGIKYLVYNGYEGTEQTFKNLSGKQIDLLHIASHGYYRRLENQERMSTFEKYHYGENNLLLRSGLLLSNAKDAIKKDVIEDNKNDGILTASEISKLNLSNIKLVTLSACNTGLGELLLGEGVYGLQRAFKVAGVKSILMTLWEVDSLATEIFMIAFYKHYLYGESLHNAFIKAQNTLKNYRDSMNIKYYSSPEYWAPFIILDGF